LTTFVPEKLDVDAMNYSSWVYYFSYLCHGYGVLDHLVDPVASLSTATPTDPPPKMRIGPRLISSLVLNGLGSLLSNNDVVTFALEGLPSTYEMISTVIVSREPFPDLKTVRSLLTTHEMRLKSKVQNPLVDATSASPMVISNTSAWRGPSLEKVNNPCWSFTKGSYRFGDACKYLHNGVHGKSTLLPCTSGLASIVPDVTRSDLDMLQSLLAKFGLNAPNTSTPSPPVAYTVSVPPGFLSVSAQLSAQPTYDFITRRVLLHYDSTGDLYPVMKPSTIPHAFLTIGDGRFILVTNSGHSVLSPLFHPLRLNNVLITPNIVKNLIFVRQTGDLYPFTKPSTIPHAFLTSQYTWHQRLRYPGSEVLRRLVSSDSISCNKEKVLVLCHTCQLGKNVKLLFVSSSSSITLCFDIVHSDLWTSLILSLSGFQYYVLFLDHYSQCLCYPHIDTNHKLRPPATPSIYLGHAANHFGYRCLDLNTNKIIISHHVTFDETVFLFPSTNSTTTPSYDFLDDSTDLISTIIHTAPITPVPALVHTPQVDVPTLPTPPIPPTPPPLPTPQSVSETVPEHAPSPTNDSPTMSIHPMVTRSHVRSTHPNPRYAGHVSAISPLPRSYKEAFNDPNWQNAMFDDRYKARLVANGSTQVEGVDVDENFSPVVKPGTIRTVLSLAISRHCPVHQLDRKYAIEILERAHMVGCNPSRTHVDTESKLGDGGTLAGCLTTQRSTLGYCVFLGNNLLSWSFKRQPTLSRSSVEAEYRGVANAVTKTYWIWNLLHELHTPLSSATIMYCDNVSVVYFFSNPVQHQRTKHIEIDIHFVRDLVATGQVRILHVPSRFQYADIFTKGLPSALFDEFHDNPNTKMVVIWNPTVKKSVCIDILVPEWRYTKEECIVVGIGVCPDTSDLKLVKIIDDKISTEDVCSRSSCEGDVADSGSGRRNSGCGDALMTASRLKLGRPVDLHIQNMMDLWNIRIQVVIGCWSCTQLINLPLSAAFGAVSLGSAIVLQVIDASIISSLDAFFFMGSVCLKSPPNIMVLPPNTICRLSCMSLRQRSRASKQRRSFISDSFQMMRSVSLSKSASWLFFMLQVHSSCKLSGILNREWAVLPDGNNKDVIPEDTTVRTILSSECKTDAIDF
nr:ribonuclease H-like domain-containing protein [Tanacetum cinerariifolium]